MGRLAALVAGGEVKSTIDAVRTLAEAPAGIEQFTAGKRGKIVISLACLSGKRNGCAVVLTPRNRRFVGGTTDSPELGDAAAVVVLPPVGGEVSPAVRPAPVSVRDAVCVSELSGADDRAGPAVDVCRLGERRNASRHIGRRLGD